jgi:hypothetical protein
MGVGNWSSPFGMIAAQYGAMAAMEAYSNGTISAMMNWSIRNMVSTSNEVDGYLHKKFSKRDNNNGSGNVFIKIPKHTETRYEFGKPNIADFMNNATAGGNDLLGYVSATAQRARDFINSYRFTSEGNFTITKGKQIALDGELLGLEFGGSYKKDVKDILDATFEMVGFGNTGYFNKNLYTLSSNKYIGYQYTPKSWSLGTVFGGSYSQKLFNYSGSDYSVKTDQLAYNYALFQSRLSYTNNHPNEVFYSIGGGLNIALYYGLELNLRVGFKRKH